MILPIQVHELHIEGMVLEEKKITMIYAITNEKLQRFIFLSNLDRELCLGQGF